MCTIKSTTQTIARPTAHYVSVPPIADMSVYRGRRMLGVFPHTFFLLLACTRRRPYSRVDGRRPRQPTALDDMIEMYELEASVNTSAGFVSREFGARCQVNGTARNG